MTDRDNKDLKTLIPVGKSLPVNTPFKKPLLSWLRENVSGMDKHLAVKPRCVWNENGGDAPDNPPICYRNGERHGWWEERFANSSVEIGPYVDGKRHGQWEIRYANGDVQIGPFANGKEHGRWEWRMPDGRVQIGPFVNGKQNGRWEFRFPDGHVFTGQFVNGKQNGRWELRGTNGDVTLYFSYPGGEVSSPDGEVIVPTSEEFFIGTEGKVTIR